MKIMHFKSYSYDHFYMLVDDDFHPGSPTEFCKKYIPYEYEPWIDEGRTFQYQYLREHPVLENGLCIIKLSFDEVDVINTNKMKKNVCDFSDGIPFLIREDRYMFHTCDIPMLTKLKKSEVKNKKYIKYER